MHGGAPLNFFGDFCGNVVLYAILSYSTKCLKFEMPKMPKVKDDNHFYVIFTVNPEPLTSEPSNETSPGRNSESR
jgi:hypothetical protein